MSKAILTLQTPFQNLKFITMLYKIMGLLPCKLINGRLKSSAWGHYYCVLWTLIHCAYWSVFYYERYLESFEGETVLNDLYVPIFRFTVNLITLISYNCVAIFQGQDIVKFSDKLETYDDRARVLGHERKDKNKFIWLFFVLTAGNVIRYAYYAINEIIADGVIIIIATICEKVIVFIVSTYCLYITSVFLDLIRQRFRHLNETIIPHVSHLPVTGSKGEITVYDIRYLHGVLIDSADLINKVYGISNMLIAFSILIEMVISTYRLGTLGINDNEIINALDLLFETTYLATMYHFATYEANRVEDRVLKYGLPFQNDKCRQDAIEMMLYFYHNRYTFTAAEFFILDLTLIFSMLSTAFTFVLILI